MLSTFIFILFLTPLVWSESNTDYEKNLAMFRVTRRYFKQNQPDKIMEYLYNTQETPESLFPRQLILMKLTQYFVSKDQYNKAEYMLDTYFKNPDSILADDINKIRAEVRMKKEHTTPPTANINETTSPITEVFPERKIILYDQLDTVVKEQLFQVYKKQHESAGFPTHNTAYEWGIKRFPVREWVNALYLRYDTDPTHNNHSPLTIMSNEMSDLNLGDQLLSYLAYLEKKPEERTQALENMSLYYKYKQEYDAGIQILAKYLNPNDLQDDTMPGSLVPLYFPRPYWAWISDSTKAENVDPYLLLSIARIETQFNIRYDTKDRQGLIAISKPFISIHHHDGVPSVLRHLNIAALQFKQYNDSFPDNYVGQIAAYYTSIEDTQKIFPTGFNANLYTQDQLLNRLTDEVLKQKIRTLLDIYILYRLIYDV